MGSRTSDQTGRKELANPRVLIHSSLFLHSRREELSGAQEKRQIMSHKEPLEDATRLLTTVLTGAACSGLCLMRRGERRQLGSIFALAIEQHREIEQSVSCREANAIVIPICL